MTGTEKTTSSIQRRLKTPLTLKFSWYLTSLVFIGIGIFYITNFIMYLILDATKTKTLFDYFTILRIQNIYNISTTKIHYYINGHTVKVLIIPAIVLLILGIVMLIVKKRNFERYTKKELEKTLKK